MIGNEEKFKRNLIVGFLICVFVLFILVLAIYLAMNKWPFLENNHPDVMRVIFFLCFSVFLYFFATSVARLQAKLFPNYLSGEKMIKLNTIYIKIFSVIVFCFSLYWIFARTFNKN